MNLMDSRSAIMTKTRASCTPSIWCGGKSLDIHVNHLGRCLQTNLNNTPWEKQRTWKQNTNEHTKSDWLANRLIPTDSPTNDSPHLPNIHAGESPHIHFSSSSSTFSGSSTVKFLGAGYGGCTLKYLKVDFSSNISRFKHIPNIYSK